MKYQVTTPEETLFFDNVGRVLLQYARLELRDKQGNMIAVFAKDCWKYFCCVHDDQKKKNDPTQYPMINTMFGSLQCGDVVKSNTGLTWVVISPDIWVETVTGKRSRVTSNSLCDSWTVYRNGACLQ